MALWGNKDSKTASGTIAIASPGGAVTGSSTSFTTQTRIGDFIRVSGEDYLITAIASNTAATVRAGIPGATLTAVGAGANQTNGGWGTGGTVKALIPVVPGETLNLEVGSKPVTIAGEPFWGYNGGGTSSAGIGAAGGGGTDIRRGSAISDRILFAGGGGGAGEQSNGGDGGVTGGDGGSGYNFGAGGQDEGTDTAG